MEKNKRYAVAYKRFPEDDSVFYNGNAVCLFGQDEGTVSHFRKHYLIILPEKKTASETYTALEKAISKEIGKECELVFTNFEPTIWRIKKISVEKTTPSKTIKIGKEGCEVVIR